MKKLILWNRKHLFVGASLLLLLALTLVACSSGFSATAPLSLSAAQATVPDRNPGSRSCPEKVDNPSYWDHIIGTQGDARVESVHCGKIMHYPGIQALITVRHHSSGSILDVYVYAKILSDKPVQFFKLQGLYKGDAKISGYKTVLTAEVDSNSSINIGKPDAQLTQDLFREFKWSDAAGAFEQIVFPGMFPDLTRWQAEADQQKVNHGQDSWKLDAVQTANNFAAKFLQAGGTTTLVSGGDLQDLDALVNLAFPSPGGGGPPRITKVTLSRLEGHAHNIWEVTAVTADWLFISSPQSGPTTSISSPVTVTGFGPQFEAQIGVVWILDHLYNKIGQVFAMAPSDLSPPTTFSVTFPYTSSFHAGAQEGIVQLLHAGGASFDYGAAMVKVLISA